MKHVRSFLSLLVLGLMLSGTAWAQGDLSLGGGGGGIDLSLATIDTDNFVRNDTINDSLIVRLVEWDTTDFKYPLQVGPKKADYKVMQFRIINESTVPDTLKSIRFASYNDKDYSVSKIALYRVGVTAALKSTTSPGAFSENSELTFSDINNVIPAGDSVTYFFTFDSDQANVDTTYNALWLGLKIFSGGITLAPAGESPVAADDTLAYDTGTLGYGNTGRLVSFDTQPPDMTAGFELVGDNGACGQNGIVNLGDTVWFEARGSTHRDIRKAWANLRVFGTKLDSIAFNTVIEEGEAPNIDTIGLGLLWVIPDTVITPVLDVAPLFYELIVHASDLAGNVRTDTLVLNYAIDNQKPIFDSVWVALSGDVNGDGIAAIGDTVQFFAYLTNNEPGEIENVRVDLTNWGYGWITMEDPSGNRRWFSTKLELTDGLLDLVENDTLSLFTVMAEDNACNFDTLSNVAPFAIDNQAPFLPLTFSYQRLLDRDANNVINIGDSVVFTIDASNTDDLATTCEVVLDLFTSGLGGNQEQCVETVNPAGDYYYHHKVLDGGIWAVDVGGNTHTVEVTLTDDAGNTATFTSNAMIQAVDTDAPEPVEDLEASLGPCAIDLSWDPANADDDLYLIFWDGGDGWTSADTAYDADGNIIFLDTLGSAYDPATSWTTDATVTLTHGLTYQFVVQTVDDANNREFNFHRVAAIADCEAPTVCINYPASGGAYGVWNYLTVIAESPDADVNSAQVYVRDVDLGTGTPGPWIAFPTGMTRIAGSQQFEYTITDTAMQDIFGMLTDDDEYELLVVGTDDVGNTQTLVEANAACADFTYMWFYTGLPVVLLSVNDTISPQTPCGFNVTRDDANVVMVNIPGHVAGRTYTFDVYLNDDGEPLLRLHYEENVATMPYSFVLNATDFPKGTHTIYVNAERDDGNIGSVDFNICVPDEDAPAAMIVYPVDGQRVRVMRSMMNPVQVWAEVVDWAYDPDPVARVNFEWGMEPDLSDGVVFDVEYATASGDYYIATWDTRSFNDGDIVYLRAIFYDDKNNTQATPIIQVYMDATTPDIILTCPQAVTLGGTKMISQYVDFYAEFPESQTEDDFRTIELWYKKSTDPDVPVFWEDPDTLGPGTSANVYVYYGFDTRKLDDNTSYDFRLIATDITGNVMFDYDDDGMFDAYTFDPASWNSDDQFFVNNTPAKIAFKEALAGGITFPTPSEKLDGKGRIYVPAREPITVWSQTIPMSDTLEVEHVTYYWDEVAVGQVTNPWYELTFNPYELGLYTDDDITDRYESFYLTVVKSDVLHREPVWDEIEVIVLDVDPSQAVITDPCWDACVWGDVELNAVTLNNHEISWVVFYYRAEGAQTWMPIDSTAYYYDDKSDGFSVTWHTLGLADGAYELAAVAVDWSFNRDANPHVVKLHVANTLPTVTMTAPAAEYGFIGNGSIFKASIGSGYTIPITKVEFWYKSIYSSSWSVWATDNYPPYEAEWDSSVTDSCALHFKVRVYNCADRDVDSEALILYNDEDIPFAVMTTVAGHDVEGGNDPTLNLTGMDTVRVVGIFDDCRDACNCPQSGLAKVGFELRDDEDSKVMTRFIEPATAGTHSALFNISGLPTGTYRFYVSAWDAVGNMTITGPVYGYIRDETPPTTSVIGFYGNRLYGFDWSGDANRVTFEYQLGAEWVGVGIGNKLSGGFWWTLLDPASIPSGTRPFRLIAVDSSGNYSPTHALQINVTSNGQGVLTFAEGSDLSNLAVLKNYQSGNSSAVLQVESSTGNTPVALGVYEQSTTPGQYSYEYEVCSMDPHLQGGMFRDNVDFDYVICGGTAVYLVGAADGAGAVHTSVSTYRYWSDYGTNGTVYGNDNTVEVTVPVGIGSSGCMMVLETWMPRSGASQNIWQPIGNHNGPLTANYISCNDYWGAPISPEGGLSLDAENGYYCCFDANKYAVIKMSYDASINVPAESLLVVRWDDASNEWRSDGIYYLYGDEGFDVENHTVEFSTRCLHGIYAVVRIMKSVNPGTIRMEYVSSYPQCEGYVGPYPTDEAPKFLFKVWDDYSGIDNGSWDIRLNGTHIVKDGCEADYWDVDYDYVTGYLGIWIDYGSYDEWRWLEQWPIVPPLTGGQNQLYIGVYNEQLNYASMTYDFTVDSTKPTVVFENSYVSKNPTITFTLNDDESGIDWDWVFVDVVAVRTTDTNWANPNQSEQLFFLGTFFPEQIQHYADKETGVVTITTHYELEDERALMVAIYDGTRSGYYYGEYYWFAGDPLTYHQWDQFYTPFHGVWDCAWNSTSPWFQVLAVDAEGPTVLAPGEDTDGPGKYLPVVCHKIKIHDDGSGVDIASLELYEDDELVTSSEGKYSYNSSTGYMSYCPTPGARVTLVVYDNVGNKTVREWKASGKDGIADLGEAINFPNPFDPREERTTIKTNFEGEVRVTIYDFAGNEVWSSMTDDNGICDWNGYSANDEMVANGVYFAYCKAADGRHKVLKIAVIKR